jgi:hypothetical protein
LRFQVKKPHFSLTFPFHLLYILFVLHFSAS